MPDMVSRLALQLLADHGHEGEFTVDTGDLARIDLLKLALEALGCRVSLVPHRSAITVTAPGPDHREPKSA